MYANGQGITRNYINAYKWWILAESQGHNDAKQNLQIIERRMTRDQIAESQKLASAFRPRKE
jgi:uncharacterized protein